MNSSDSAEELVKISLDGMEVALKIAGEGAKNIAVMIYTIMKDKQQTKGKTRLTNMLKSGKTLKIFTIKAEDLKKFSQEAKRYGVLYCALANKKNSKIDGMVDILVREEDSSKINRISERFNFADVATIEKELEKEKQAKQELQDKGVKEKSKDELFIEELLKEPIAKEEQQKETTPSNITENTEEKNQSENFLNIKQDENKTIKNENKKSVKQELKEIEKEVQERENREKEKENRTITNSTKNKQKAKHFKENNEQKKPKHLKEPKHLDTTKRNKRKKYKKERGK